MVATFRPVDKNFAIRAAFPVLVGFFVYIVAITFVFLHHALAAVLPSAGRTGGRE